MFYKGYYIDGSMLDDCYTVCYCGDEIVFDTIQEAMEFIDEISR